MLQLDDLPFLKCARQGDFAAVMPQQRTQFRVLVDLVLVWGWTYFCPGDGHSAVNDRDRIC